MAGLKQDFSAKEAAKISGVAYRTLDHWARTDFIVPSIREAQGSGTERRYSFADLVALRVARELRSAGIGMRSLRTLVQHLRRAQNLSEPLSEARLLVAGNDVILVDSQDCNQLISVLNKPGQAAFAFMFDLRRTVVDLRRTIKKNRAA